MEDNEENRDQSGRNMGDIISKQMNMRKRGMTVEKTGGKTGKTRENQRDQEENMTDLGG